MVELHRGRVCVCSLRSRLVFLVVSSRRLQNKTKIPHTGDYLTTQFMQIVAHKKIPVEFNGKNFALWTSFLHSRLKSKHLERRCSESLESPVISRAALYDT